MLTLSILASIHLRSTPSLDERQIKVRTKTSMILIPAESPDVLAGPVLYL